MTGPFTARILAVVTAVSSSGECPANTHAETLSAAAALPPVFGVPKMGELVQHMLRESLDAFVEGDSERAKRVLTMDDDVDALYGETLRLTLAWMAEHPKENPYAMCVASAAKYLERIADHATNLAEHVVYLERGDDVRHGGAAGKSPVVQREFRPSSKGPKP